MVSPQDRYETHKKMSKNLSRLAVIRSVSCALRAHTTLSVQKPRARNTYSVSRVIIINISEKYIENSRVSVIRLFFFLKLFKVGYSLDPTSFNWTVHTVYGGRGGFLPHVSVAPSSAKNGGSISTKDAARRIYHNRTTLRRRRFSNGLFIFRWYLIPFRLQSVHEINFFLNYKTWRTHHIYRKLFKICVEMGFNLLKGIIKSRLKFAAPSTECTPRHVI